MLRVLEFTELFEPAQGVPVLGTVSAAAKVVESFNDAGDRPRKLVVVDRELAPARLRELLAELEAINNKDVGEHNPRAKSWMDKVKEFFAE